MTRPSKIHDAPIPLAGGLAVLTGLLLPLAAATVIIHFGLLGNLVTRPAPRHEQTRAATRHSPSARSA